VIKISTFQEFFRTNAQIQDFSGPEFFSSFFRTCGNPAPSLWSNFGCPNVKDSHISAILQAHMVLARTLTSALMVQSKFIQHVT